MPQQDFLYTLAHREYYEDLSWYECSDRFRTILERLLPSERWELIRRSLWLHAKNEARDSPRQGFKIHVSSTSEHAESVLEVVATECFERRVSFKVAADRRLLNVMNSKIFARSASGKFMTLYPRDDAEFIDLIDHLHRITRDEPWQGPYILSDRRYKDSKILYYRYGGIKPSQQLRIDGVKQSVLTTPDGGTVRDHRRAFFQLPDWVEDPFGGSREIVDQPNPVLGGRFRIESMLMFSNRGGVYKAEDRLTGESVVLKEARPCIQRVAAEGHAIDSTQLLEREYSILEKLEDLGCSPKPVALFDEWEHRFLAQEHIAGVTLKRFVAKVENITTPHILRDGVLDEYLPTFKRIALELLDIVEEVHGRGVILGDLSLGNVIVDPTGSRLTLIDLESAVTTADDQEFLAFSKNWFTPGFARPGRAEGRTLSFADDLYAVGMVLYGMFIAGMQFFDLKPEGRELFLDELVELGLPIPVREAVLALLAGDLNRGREAVRAVEGTRGVASARKAMRRS